MAAANDAMAEMPWCAGTAEADELAALVAATPADELPLGSTPGRRAAQMAGRAAGGARIERLDSVPGVIFARFEGATSLSSDGYVWLAHQPASRQLIGIAELTPTRRREWALPAEWFRESGLL